MILIKDNKTSLEPFIFGKTNFSTFETLFMWNIILSDPWIIVQNNLISSISFNDLLLRQ